MMLKPTTNRMGPSRIASKEITRILVASLRLRESGFPEALGIFGAS
jgi:hypothetical protein